MTNFVKRVVALSALFACVALGLRAQNLVVGADFDTRFDNREYSGSEFGVSQTLFSARLTPYVGVEWKQCNRLIFGVDMLQDFGDHTKFLTSVNPVFYYQFRNRAQTVKVDAGIFDRRELVGDYSKAFFSDSTLFYHNRLSGYLAHYTSPTLKNTYAEFAIDWEGRFSAASREKFRILSAGRYTPKDIFYVGYAFSMFHFAGSYSERNVTDNLLFGGYVGAAFRAYFDFDVKLQYLVAPQRVRRFTDGWQCPMGGELDFAMSKWGVKLQNTLYVGGNLMQYYWLYGSELYAGCRFYSTTNGIYNRTFVGYANTFFDDTLSVDAGMVFHYDGSKLTTQQVVQVGVRFLRLVDISPKSKR